MKKRLSFLVAMALLPALTVIIWFGPYFWARWQPNQLPQESVELGGVQTEPTLSANTLQIPSLGIEAPIQYVREQSEAAYQSALEYGVVHYPGTALPGQPGNVYIFGHSSDYPWSPGKYKTVFARLPEIEMGADIFVSDSDGNVYQYLVSATKVVNPKDLSVLDQFDNEVALLSLQTSYPLGTTLQRFVVIGQLQE